jgi:hypothetical protein
VTLDPLEPIDKSLLGLLIQVSAHDGTCFRCLAHLNRTLLKERLLYPHGGHGVKISELLDAVKAA